MDQPAARSGAAERVEAGRDPPATPTGSKPVPPTKPGPATPTPAAPAPTAGQRPKLRAVPDPAAPLHAPTTAPAVPASKEPPPGRTRRQQLNDSLWGDTGLREDPVPEWKAERLARIDELNRTEVPRDRANGYEAIDHGPGCVCDLCAGTFTEQEREAALALRRWQQRMDKTEQEAQRRAWRRVSGPNGRSTGMTINMRSEWGPRVTAVGDAFREAEAQARALAADLEPGGANQAVKDFAAEMAAAAAKLAGTTDDLHATSRTADATAWEFTEEKPPSQAQDWM